MSIIKQDYGELSGAVQKDFGFFTTTAVRSVNCGFKPTTLLFAFGITTNVYNPAAELFIDGEWWFVTGGDSTAWKKSTNPSQPQFNDVTITDTGFNITQNAGGDRMGCFYLAIG